MPASGLSVTLHKRERVVGVPILDRASVLPAVAGLRGARRCRTSWCLPLQDFVVRVITSTLTTEVPGHEPMEQLIKRNRCVENNPGLITVDRKKRIMKGGLVYRLNYEEKRLYIHEIGGGADVDNNNCCVIATSIDRKRLPPTNTIYPIRICTLTALQSAYVHFQRASSERLD
jgi:hypothetical protein